jgi:hypothetical protein
VSRWARRRGDGPAGMSPGRVGRSAQPEVGAGRRLGVVVAQRPAVVLGWPAPRRPRPRPRDSAPALTSITHAVSDAATPACARQTTPAFVRGCRTNRSANRCVNQSWDNSAQRGGDRWLSWDAATNQAQFRRVCPTVAEATSLELFVRQPHLYAGATPVVVWRALAGRFIGRSDPDTSHQRGRSFDGASLWCRLGRACESSCVERPARQLRVHANTPQAAAGFEETTDANLKRPADLIESRGGRSSAGGWGPGKRTRHEGASTRRRVQRTGSVISTLHEAWGSGSTTCPRESSRSK